MGNIGTMRQIYDVCVFGGGPAGTALAARLADLGIASIVLDRPPGRKAWRGESLTGVIRQPLSALGLWEEFRGAGHVAGYAQRSAWGGEPWIQDSIYHVHGNRWHVDRARFDADLREAVRRRGIVIRDYRNLEELQREGREWRIGLDKGIEISSRFLVDATGRARAIARRLGLRPRIYDRLIALTALIPRNRNPEFDHTMVVESTAHGWWYAAPVPQGHVLAFFHRAMTNGILAADAISRHLTMEDTLLLEEYRRHCQDQFERYLTGLGRHYSYERRWASAPFWKRRSNANT